MLEGVLRLAASWMGLVACGFSPSVVDHGPDGNTPGGLANDASGSGSSAYRSHRIDVAAAKVSGGPHASFPVLVSLTASWLRGTAAGGEIASAAGYDIYFSSDLAGSVRLAHEIERYRSDTGELVAWVKLPMLSTTTTFYLQDGDPTITTSQENKASVWSAGYAAVWHLSDLADSTTQNPGTNNGASDASGKIANARAFDGAGNVVSAGTSASVDDAFAAGGTAEAWFSATGWGGSGLGRIFDKGTGSTLAIGMCNANVAGAFLFGHSFSTGAGNWCTPSGSLALNAWTHVAVVYDSSSSANLPIIYVNGTAMALGTISTPSGSPRSEAGAALTLGDRAAAGRAFAGIIDEARLSRVVRSAGWIATSYEDQRDPASFCIVTP